MVAKMCFVLKALTNHNTQYINNTFTFNKYFYQRGCEIIRSELGTFKWWISGLRLNPLFS